MAEYLGDPTARLAGRLTLNPIPHLDLFGSFIIPLLLFFSSSPIMLGWAKPVPYNPYNLRNQRWGDALVASAGPLSNLAIALSIGLFVRFGEGFLNPHMINLAVLIVFVNTLLAIFNLIPVPPLDGSKIFLSFLPYHLGERVASIQALVGRFGFVATIAFLFIFAFFLLPPFFSLVVFVVKLITGFSADEILRVISSLA